MNIRKTLAIILLLISITINAQSKNVESSKITGTILDSKDNSPLPYTTIYIISSDTGVFSNEKGVFSINTSELEADEIIRFKRIGYKSSDMKVSELINGITIKLVEESMSLDEVILTNKNINPREIVKKILLNQSENYKTLTSKKQIFLRHKRFADIDKFELNYKKSTIDNIDESVINKIEEELITDTTYYDDFLADIYIRNDSEQKSEIKTKPIKFVALKEKDIAGIKQIKTLFKNEFEGTNKKEYWKIKSGIFGSKIDINEDKGSIISVKTDVKKDVNRDTKLTSNMSYDILNHIKDTQFLKETEWEFLHKPRRYNYTLIGTVEVDDEEVYIIEFEPKRKGLYIGEMYVSTETFALIKADYEYAEGKSGIDISLLKFIYKKEQSKISIAFEKINGNYELKYFSEKTIFSIGAKRKLALQKKRNRFLIDKKLRELKIKLNMLIKRESSVEFFVINREEITDSEYDNFKQEKYVDIIRIDEFDDNIWGNHPTIEPTKRMKEYKKIKI
ncbi:MAG: carboxypeptidase-like regulatory domain-containing protein [Flavobacteriaceae bacterium]|nr:carboxypeptidase-like regulatory domain-containing protein [Flavobacteriaceae bacterium]